MSIKHQVQDLYEKRSFAKRLNRNVKRYNRAFHDEIELNEMNALVVAGRWRRIITGDYEFEEGNFAILIEEMLGELLYEVVDNSPFTLDLEEAPLLSSAQAGIWFIIELYNTILNLTVEPPISDVRNFARALCEDPNVAHSFAAELNLPHPVKGRGS